MSRMRIGQQEIRQADIFEILLDSFPDMIHSVDDEGRIVYANRTAETLLGYNREELLCMNVRQIYAQEVLDAMERGFKALKTDGDKRVESLLQAKDGTRIPVEIRSFGIYDDEGRFVRTFSILRDIRKIKELQNSLVHAGRLAAIGELAAGIAHDIHNPLTVVLLAAEMVNRSCARPEMDLSTRLELALHYVDDITKAAHAIEKLADHLRDFSRGMVQRYESLDLHDAVSDALFIVQSKIAKSGVQVRNRVAKGRHYILGCPNQVEQIFANLFSNASDAMRGRDVRNLTIEIEPFAADGTDYWRCRVSDSGCGIPEELREQVFQSFFTTKPQGEGTGLGLAISRGIVNEHKGHITLSSEVGAGSTFAIDLPRLAET